jgi:hypothetical protein
MDDLIRDFEAGTLDATRFGHREHLQVAFWFLQQYPLEEALARFVQNLKRLTVRLGVPHKYHATFTWGYMVLLDEARSRAPAASFEQVIAANPQLLLAPAAALAPFYAPDQLQSEEARQRFMMPRRT